MSSALWGTVVGAFGAGRPSDRFGRRPCLVALGALYLASAVGCALAWNWAALIFFRIIGGLAIGASSVIGPMYIAEISPAVRRGRMVGLFQLNIVVGILLAYLCNFWVSSFGFGPSEWRWKLGTGINAILYYLNFIFERAGFNKVSSDMQAVMIGFTNLLFTVAAMSVIDRFGRRKLLLSGAIGTAICLAGVAAVFAGGQRPHLLLWLLIGFIASFAFSQGAVIWVYLSEVFPNLVRAKGQSLGSFTHWVMNALISAVFPVMAARSGATPFVFFAVMMVTQFFVVLKFYPETARIRLEEIGHRV